MEHPDALQLEFPQHPDRQGIRRAVIDDEQLVPFLSLKGGDALVEKFSVVKAGNHDGDARAHHREAHFITDIGTLESAGPDGSRAKGRAIGGLAV